MKIRYTRRAALVAASLLVALCGGAVLRAGDAAAQAAAGRAAATSGLPTARPLLNSERIAARFGNYGITVLASDPRVRVSDLYSEADGVRTCRTFAVVRYPVALDPALAAEHAEIVRGGSIGAVFAARGWQVVKTHLRYFELEAPERVAALMRVATGTRLAAHAYELDVVKDGRTFEYALLAEIHHPDYLVRADLRAIYGPADASGHEAALEDLLGAALAVAGASGGTPASASGAR